MADADADGQSGKSHCFRSRRPDPLVQQVIYVPADARERQDVGDLLDSRVDGQDLEFCQIAPFEQWLRPCRSVPVQPSGPRWKENLSKSQMSWLSRFHPESSIGRAQTKKLVINDLASLYEDSWKTTPSSLLALGEIPDLRDPGHVTTLPVVALASGSQGHILRIAALAKGDWAWARENVAVGLNHFGMGVQGESSHAEGMRPISLIKFVTDTDGRFDCWWIMVQRQTTTTVYEPRLATLPAKSCPWSDDNGGGQARISVDPAFTIPYEEVADSHLCDVSCNPMPSKKSPQLAVVYQSGYWSIWKIKGYAARGTTSPRPVKSVCGTVSSAIYHLTPTSYETRRPLRALWLDKQRSKRGAPLLVSSSSSLHVFETKTGELQTGLNLFPFGEPGQILDVQSSPFSPAQALVLTNTAFVWITVAETTAEDGSSGVSSESLVSCPHWRDTTEDLRLGVSSAWLTGDQWECFAFVWSRKNGHVTVLTISGLAALDGTYDGREVRYRKKDVFLDGLFGLRGMCLMPVTLRLMSPEETMLERYATWSANWPNFCQVLALGSDLDLSCALCLWCEANSGQGLVVPPPDVRLHEGQDTNAQTCLDWASDVQDQSELFAVPDDFEEFLPAKSIDMVGSGVPPIKNPTARTKDLDFSVLSLRQKGSMDDGDMPRDLEQSVQDVQQKLARGGIPYGNLLQLLGPRHDLATLQTLANLWDDHCAATAFRHGLKVVRVAPALASLVKSYSVVCEPLTRGGGRIFKKTRRRIRHILRRAEAMVSLSQIQVYLAAKPSTSVATPVNAICGSQDIYNGLPPSSPPDRPSSPLLPSTATKREINLGEAQQQEQQAEDTETPLAPAAALLRKYTTLDHIPPRKGGELLVVSHWDVGGDPAQTKFMTQQEEQDVEAVRERRRKRDARRRKVDRQVAAWHLDAENLASSQHAVSSLVVPASQSLGQPVPISSEIPVVMSSQRPAVMSSQIPVIMSSRSPGPGERTPVSLSRLVPGMFGSGSTKAKRPKKKREGFR